MARKRTLDRRTLRDQAEAAEARGQDEEEIEDEAPAEDDAGDDDGGDDDGEAKPKKKAPAKKKPAAPKRTRAPKEVRTKAVWVVFDNGSKRVDTFPYNQKADAEALLARKQEEKKGTFYIQLVKEAME